MQGRRAGFDSYTVFGAQIKQRRIDPDGARIYIYMHTSTYIHVCTMYYYGAIHSQIT